MRRQPEKKEKRKKRTPEQKARRGRTIRRVLLGLTLLCLSFVMFGAIYVLRLDAWEAFDPGRILDAPQSLLVYDKDGAEISCLSAKETRINIPLRDVPTHVRYAFISAEDNRFYEHIGVDFIRILGAAWEDIKAGGYVQGASTISQQLVKLSHLTNEKLMSRKLEEAVLAYQMEQQYSKDEILEMYLNYVYFGGGFYGIEAAARGYFGVHANELSVAQAAQLAGILKSPSHYAPHLNMEASVERRNLVLRLMQEYGYIDEQACNAAQEEPVTLNNGLNQEKRGYYIDLALEQACNQLDVSMDDLLTGGYRLYTAMDTQLQARCEEVLKDPAMFPEKAGDAQAALVVVNAKTGGVAALMGGRESSTALAYNRATRIRRQPGSVIKPIIAYAPALEEYRYTTVSMLLDEPTDFNGYKPENFNEKYRGWVTMRESVAQSLNIPAVKVLNDIGVNAGKRFAESVGISFDEQDNSLALALGGFTYGVSPYQIAGAYTTFANGGLYSTPSLVLSISDSAGNPLYTYEPERERVMSEENAFILNDMLQSAIREGTGHRLGELDFALAGKTGTTGEGEGNRDAWMAAYNPEYAAAVWMGYDDSEDGQLPQDATGGKYPAMILTEVFSKLYENRQAPVFQKPAGVLEVRLDGFTLENAHMAALASALTPPDSVVREVFVAGTEPENVNDYWVVPQPPTTFLSQLDVEGRAQLTFMPPQSFMLYRLYREDSHGVALLLGEWPGSNGAIHYTDLTAEPGKTYEYYVIPAHPQLQIGGKQVVGPATKHLTVQIPVNPFIAGGE